MGVSEIQLMTLLYSIVHANVTTLTVAALAVDTVCDTFLAISGEDIIVK